MRRRRTDEADALATRVRKAITLHCKKWLRNINTRQDPKEASAKSARSRALPAEAAVTNPTVSPELIERAGTAAILEFIFARYFFTVKMISMDSMTPKT